MAICAREGCNTPLPASNGNRPRIWCSETCRKRAAPRMTVARADGPVTMTLRAALAAAQDVALPPIDGAYAALGLALAQAVDQGSVPAARELRAVLDVLAGRVDDDTAAFLRSVQTPYPGGPGWPS
jgi:hypothetical protein